MKLLLLVGVFVLFSSGCSTTQEKIVKNCPDSTILLESPEFPVELMDNTPNPLSQVDPEGDISKDELIRLLMAEIVWLQEQNKRFREYFNGF